MSMRRTTLINWINLRTLAVCLGLVIVLLPQRPAFTSWLDQLLFKSGVALMQPRTGELTIATIELPASEMESLTHDLGRAGQARELMKKLLVQDATIGLIFDDVPQQQTSWAQTTLEELRGNADLSGEINKASRQYLAVENDLRKIFESAQVVLGSGEPPGFVSIQSEASSSSDLVRWLPGWLQPQLQPPTTMANGFADETAVNIFPVENTANLKNISQSLLLQLNNEVGLSFLSQLYARFSHANDVVWKKNQELSLGNGVVVASSADGGFMPFYNQWLQSIPQISSLTLEQALQNLPQQNLIVLGVNSAQLESTARALLSLEHEAYFSEPAWVVLATIALTLLILVYLVTVLPRLATVAGLLASCLIIVLMLVVQVGWQITQWVWIPMGVLAQYLVVGHILVSLWKSQRDRLFTAQAAAHGARYQLGLQLFRDGRADDALLAIKECYVSDAVAQLMYDIAAQQERKRQYSAAIKTYQLLNQQKKQFRDVGEKIEKLIAFSSGTAAHLTTGGDVAKTLIISETTINKPVLGRYEIERELGRGAMGVVYLGRDPKISRQVAIKTLSYSSLDQSHLEEFKQRFFREAEAAGRLSHPNIVTIYDVGEEHDLAFIAMDYIEGKALNVHVSEETLLPVTTVYQIIMEVAEGLSYAHDKKIIHRDIKPGNIMYQPENETVKITDFGVARIVDSAKTNTGDILGSPLYMSPEQLKGEKVTAQTDIYSLGVTLYQLLTGNVPFTGDSIASLTYSIINEKHKGVRELRPELPVSATRIVNKALSKDPTKRYKTVVELAKSLRRSLREDFR